MSIKNDPKSRGVGVYSSSPSSSLVKSTGIGSSPSKGASDRFQVGGLELGPSGDKHKNSWGHRGSGSSQVGFASLTRGFGELSQKTKKVVVASLVGFTLLLPPTVGQLMHPGTPKAAASPVAMMVAEKSESKTGADIRRDVTQAVRQLPSGLGEAREDGLRRLISVHDDAAKVLEKSNTLSSQAQRMMDQLGAEVGVDAKLGYAVDWYWFGVPPKHADFHAGKSDTKGIHSHTADVRGAFEHARTVARTEVSNLLIEESPAYAQLHASYRHEASRLTAATQIRDLAQASVDALGTAQHTITMRNLTPRTVEEDVYETRTTTVRNADGTTSSSSEQVKVGTRTVDNPTWQFWNLAAITAKASAESNVRALNGSLETHRSLLGLDARQGLDASLIGVLDILGHPSFFVWSFDSQDVARTKEQASELKGFMDGVTRQIKVVHDKLEREVNAEIDARWDQLEKNGGGGRPEREQDPIARTGGRRKGSEDQGSGSWG